MTFTYSICIQNTLLRARNLKRKKSQIYTMIGKRYSKRFNSGFLTFNDDKSKSIKKSNSKRSKQIKQCGLILTQQLSFFCDL